MAEDDGTKTKRARRNVPSTLREAQKQLTLEKLLEAAREVFHEKGYSGTTVDDIVDAAGVSRGTFYLHFPGKNEVLGELFVRDHIDPVLTLIHQMPDAADVERFAAWIRSYLQLYGDQRVIVRTWIQAGSREAGVRAASSGILDRVLDELGTRVDSYRAQAGLATAPEDTRTRALLMFIMVQEFAYYEFLRGYPVDESTGITLIARLWYSAVVDDAVDEARNAC